MPEFVLNKPRDRKPPHPYYALSTFAQGYVEAMFFTNGDTGEERENLLNDLGVERLTKEAIADIAKDCERFESTVMPDGCFARQWIDRAHEATGYDDEQAGRDFWFTRQGHGTGFWARTSDELPEEIGNGLTNAAKSFSEASCEVYRGWIYHR